MTKKLTAKKAAIETLEDRRVRMSDEDIYKDAVDNLHWPRGKKPTFITMAAVLRKGAKDGEFTRTKDLRYGLPTLKAEYNKDVLYVLKNPAMPNYLKVGVTGRSRLRKRVKELSKGTGVPEPFRCMFAVQAKTQGATKLEGEIQEELFEYKASNKEFYKKIGLKRIKEMVTEKLSDGLSDGKDKIIVDKDEETDVEDETHTSDRSSAGPTRSKKVKTRFTGFSELDIPPGTELTLKGDPSIICEVSKKDPRNKKVRYQGLEMSLSKATALARKSRTGPPGTKCWEYKGRTIRQIMDKKSS